jgi:hypothetical protein
MERLLSVGLASLYGPAVRAVNPGENFGFCRDLEISLDFWGIV